MTRVSSSMDERWQDLVDFEIVAVLTSKEAAETITPML